MSNKSVKRQLWEIESNLRNYFSNMFGSMRILPEYANDKINCQNLVAAELKKLRDIIPDIE